MTQREILRLHANPTKRQEAIARSERGLPPVEKEAEQEELAEAVEDELEMLLADLEEEKAIEAAARGIKRKMYPVVRESSIRKPVSAKMRRLHDDDEPPQKPSTTTEQPKNRKIPASFSQPHTPGKLEKYKDETPEERAWRREQKLIEKMKKKKKKAAS